MSGRATAMSRGHTQRAASAADYYRSRLVPERLEEALNLIYHRGPEDVYGELSRYFAALSDPPVISDVRGRKVLDGAGKVTLEAEVECTVRTVEKKVCVATVCSDTEDAGRQESVETAIQWIRDAIAPSLRGAEPREQSAIDHMLSDYFRVKKQEEKQRRDDESENLPSPTASLPSPAPSPPSSRKMASGKGKKAPEKPLPLSEQQDPPIRGNLAIAAVSLAVAKSSAVLQDVPLYSHIATLKQQPSPPEPPVTAAPLISLLSCAKSSPGKLNLMKEVLVIPPLGTPTAQSLDLVSSLQTQILKQMESQSKSGSVIRSVSSLGCLVLACDRLDQPLELVREACEGLGLHPGTDVHVAINCAAHELADLNRGRYEVVSGSWKSPDEMVDLYVDLVTAHPAIIALLDPFRREDRPQWEALGKAVGSRCYLLADTASRSVTDLLPGSNAPVCCGHVLTLANETTVSDLLAAVRLMEGEGLVTVLGCSSEECAEDGVVDLAVGLGVRFMKLGGLLRGERTAKYNRLLAIEEDLTRSGTLGRQEQFKFPALWNDPGILKCPEEST
ncbi:enolase 4 isoform X2 [Dendrobates tinctorius]|uniref:enolase 4 isoform X2 n=1 Tax=Dendrobates tinctorius TaxID=92724 RepID=UPI003CCA1161